MGNSEEGDLNNESFISKDYVEIEREKEQRFVNLMVEIIVSMTLKELYQGEDDLVTRNKKKNN